MRVVIRYGSGELRQSLLDQKFTVIVVWTADSSCYYIAFLLIVVFQSFQRIYFCLFYGQKFLELNSFSVI